VKSGAVVIGYMTLPMFAKVNVVLPYCLVQAINISSFNSYFLFCHLALFIHQIKQHEFRHVPKTDGHK